jgi:hypothetical protein
MRAAIVDVYFCGDVGGNREILDDDDDENGDDDRVAEALLLVASLSPAHLRRSVARRR